MRLSLTFAVLLCLLPIHATGQTCQSISNVVYATYVDAAGQTQSLRLDMLLPAGAAAPTPVVVWIHGGGWRTGSRTPIPTRAANLCPRGNAVVSIDYRLTGVARWPAQIQDARAAVRWLRARAPQYNLDASRIAAWGNSAGGHLAAMLGTAGGVRTATVGSASVDLEGTIGGNSQYSSRVQAAVSWYPLTDFLQERFYPMNRDPEATASYEGDLLGGKIQDRPELAATANPAAYATADDPPLLTMHGTADTVAPFNQSELLVDALFDEGVDARLYAVQGATHTTSYFDRTTHLNAVYAFLESALASPVAPPPPAVAPPVSSSGVRVEAIDRTGTEAGDRAQFRFTRGGSVSASLAVTYTVGGTATHASDYAFLARTITIPAGAASATVDVVPLEDDLRESSETVIVTIAESPSYALGSPRTASVFIRDNDTGRPTVSVSATDRAASEAGGDSGAFMVTRTGSTTNALTVSLRTGGSATAGADYTRLPDAVTFASGVSRITLTVTPLADSLTEGAELVTLGVVPSSTIFVGPYDRAQVAITDAVAPPPPPPPPALPTGWQSRDIGDVGLAGSASYSNGTFTVRGAGADVWGTADAFHYAYRTVSGNATIVARVSAIAGTQAWTKVGVMIRGSATPGSAHAFMIVSAGKGLAFQRRTAEGGVTTHTSGGSGTAPRWVKLTRDGSTIVASVSADGAAWTEVGRDTLSLPASALVGLAVSSHDRTRLATGTFQAVAITTP